MFEPSNNCSHANCKIILQKPKEYSMQLQAVDWETEPDRMNEFLQCLSNFENIFVMYKVMVMQISLNHFLYKMHLSILIFFSKSNEKRHNLIDHSTFCLSKLTLPDFYLAHIYQIKWTRIWVRKKKKRQIRIENLVYSTKQNKTKRNHRWNGFDSEVRSEINKKK